MSDTTALPLFPLGSVLYPGGLLPLQIFEVRYLNLIKQCLRDNTPFGVIALEEGDEVRKPGESIALAQYGTLAHITQHEALTPTLLKVRCTGGERFELVSAQQEMAGLWVGQVRLLPTEPAQAIPPDLMPLSNKLRELMDNIEAQQLPESQWPFLKPYAYEDCAWVANRWCEVLPLPTATKVQLLGLNTGLLRLELVADILSANGLLNPT